MMRGTRTKRLSPIGRTYFLFPSSYVTLCVPVPVIDSLVVESAFQVPIPIIDLSVFDPFLQIPVFVVDLSVLDMAFDAPIPVIDRPVPDPFLDLLALVKNRYLLGQSQAKHD